MPIFRILAFVAAQAMSAGATIALLLFHVGAAIPALLSFTGAAEAAPSAERGEYLFRAAGCYSCHTDVKNRGPALAGGRALKTPFGTFYAPNITPDRTHGIGGWSDADFVRALREGVAPDGSHYFPVFPYMSYSGMSERDLLDLKAYIFSRPPVALANRPHDADFPFGWRFPLIFWKTLYFTQGSLAPDPARSATWNRGRYLVRALAHCGECHTPRGWLGAPDTAMEFAGIVDGPEGSLIPNITTDKETGIGDWPVDDVVLLLKFGIAPDGDVVGDLMGEVVEHGTSHLRDDDLRAIALYLQTLPPVRHRVEAKK